MQLASKKLLQRSLQGMDLVTQLHSQNGNPSKINPEKVACFSSPKNDRQLTSFHQQPTTTSPAKNHVLHPVFAKTPSKNAGYPRPKKLLQKRSLFRLRLRFLRRDDD